MSRLTTASPSPFTRDGAVEFQGHKRDLDCFFYACKYCSPRLWSRPGCPALALFAYEFAAAATTMTTTERARPSSTCAYAQTSLTASQWNLDRVAHGSTRASRLDGAFEPPECLCGRGVHVFVLDTGCALTSAKEATQRLFGQVESDRKG